MSTRFQLREGFQLRERWRRGGARSTMTRSLCSDTKAPARVRRKRPVEKADSSDSHSDSSLPSSTGPSSPTCPIARPITRSAISAGSSCKPLASNAIACAAAREPSRSNAAAYRCLDRRFTAPHAARQLGEPLRGEALLRQRRRELAPAHPGKARVRIARVLRVAQSGRLERRDEARLRECRAGGAPALGCPPRRA